MPETMDKKDIRSLSLDELKEEMDHLGERPFRALQVYRWLHAGMADSFGEMTDIPLKLRDTLDLLYYIPQVRLLDRQVSSLDGTNKFLFRLDDGNLIESVLMKYRHGNSLCISSQAGCRMGCRFCASAIGGLARNLLASEMLGEVYAAGKISGERISNIVVMGTGEPLDNYDSFVRFVRLISDEHGLCISQRNITASTCGIVPAIKRLSGENLKITLALSLHAATQEKRKEIMPVANKYELWEVLHACDEYFRKTGRRITYEYSLIHGVNDGKEDADKLISLLKTRNCHVNLIPVNPVREREFCKPTRERALNFKNKLEKNGINVTIRRELGSDIDGACGQLRRRYAKQDISREEADDGGKPAG